MEDTRAPQTESVTASPVRSPAPRRRRVSILAVLWRVLVSLLIIAGAGYYATSLIGSRPEPPQRQARERSFTVAVTEAETGTFSPRVQAFGEVVAARNMDIRTQVAGEAVEVSPNLVVGGAVERGELLVRIDSFAYDGAVRDAEAALADARLQLTTAEEQLELEQINLEAAQTQLELARRDLERAQALAGSGSITDKTIEDRELLVSQREQAVAQGQSSIRVQQATIDRQTTAIARAEWSLEQAQRALQNTEIRAPFDGIVTAQSAEVGRVISNNEVVAQIYDRDALEARFTLSDQQYGMLVNAGLIDRPVTAVWDIEPNPLTVNGSIVRAGAEVDAALGGVEVFARLDSEDAASLRPGTFVEIGIEGPAYENALRLPETAIYENNHIYVVGEDHRMARVDIALLARDGQNVIARGNMPEGARIIATRVAQAGEGVLVTIEGEEEPQPQRVRRGGGGPGGGG